jgi:NAD dependent epimerase/dehydratase family enzyme
MDMQFDILWSGALTGLIGFVGWMLRNYVEEQKRLQILLNRTREEMAKEYITKSEVHNDINRVMDRLDALDAKIDRLIENYAR